MRMPQLETCRILREKVDVFRGYNGGSRIPEGEFAQMENLTSDKFPLLSPRRRRGIYARPGSCGGLIAKDSLCWTDGSRFVINGYPIEMGLTEGRKQLVSMGAYVVIFPDRKYINTAYPEDRGMLDAVFTTAGTVKLEPAMQDGQVRIPDVVGPEAPAGPINRLLWLDTSRSPAVLLAWSEYAGQWEQVEDCYVKISAPNIGKAFREYDGVTLSGLPEEAAGLAGAAVIWRREEDFIVVPGILGKTVSTAKAVTVSRKMPQVDFVIESGNRLWGCRYGLDGNGKPINAIYCSKLGDFRNWNCFMGLSTDSYAVDLGADGPFTGAVSHMGYPVFFRENCLHKIYGSFPAAFRLQTTPCRGVQKGCEGSLAIVGEVLYYKSPGGICAYDGALPVEVSAALGTEAYGNAAAGSYGSKYYISMEDARGEYHLFVYDGARKLWHREDGFHAVQMCRCREELFYLDAEGTVWAAFGSGEPEEEVRWMAQTGELGLNDPDGKYLTRLTLQMWMSRGSRVRVLVCYDSQDFWETAAVLKGSGLGTFSLPLRIRRCSHVQLRLEGSGDARVYSVIKSLEQGSDVV